MTVGPRTDRYIVGKGRFEGNDDPDFLVEQFLIERNNKAKLAEGARSKQSRMMELNE